MSYLKHNYLTIFSVLIGAIVAGFISPETKYFWTNFLYYWCPQLACILVLFIFKVNKSIRNASMVAMASYLLLFDIWTNDSLAWLIYIFTVPGITLGGLLFNMITHKPITMPGYQIISLALISNIMGLGTIYIIFYSTI